MAPPVTSSVRAYSAALCRGLIEAPNSPASTPGSWSIPRLYAAASLKPIVPGDANPVACDSIPRLYAAASLKPLSHPGTQEQIRSVFRGSMPRPH